jgi:NAD-dependent DNA ligase
MKIKTIEYAETKTQPGFNNVKVGFIAEVGKDENADDVLKALKEKVGIETSPELRTFSNIISEYRSQAAELKLERDSLNEEVEGLAIKLRNYKTAEEILKEAKDGF